MANTTVSINNGGKPAPRWYRIAKQVIYLLTGGSVLSGTLTRFGVSDKDCLLIMGWIVTIGEVLGFVLANSEVYASKLYVINEVDNLPTIGVDGQWYHLPDGGSLYFYYLNGAWHSVDNAAIGGGTVGTPK